MDGTENKEKTAETRDLDERGEGQERHHAGKETREDIGRSEISKDTTRKMRDIDG